MTRKLSRAESWEKVHEAFERINFNSFDFDTIKASLIDYMKLYYPENFNDFIESNEFIALLELFAYVGQLLAYRVDLNAHENYITTAERKESILRLAKMISYDASRNIPARGLVKINSIQTTERVLDSSGRNLAGKRIIWNDPNNSNWKEQFILVMNRVLEQQFGDVSPSDRVQVDDVLFELYTVNNNPLRSNGKSVMSYTATTNDGNFPMELVPVQLNEDGPEERRPEVNAKFSLLFADSGLGDGSPSTGFLMFTKQGTLGRKREEFDGITPNQTFDIDVENINDTDVWVNNVDPDTREILQTPATGQAEFLFEESSDYRYGEWVQVDSASAQNILFNTNPRRQKFEIETLDDDKVRIIFGDGEFAAIPSGQFDFWYRTSANENITIPRNAVAEKSNSLTYTDSNNRNQTLTFTFSLINSLQNASESETLEHIRRVAPAQYFAQNRMVNGQDYNTFPLRDPSILKLRTINRTFAGDSKYISWFDSSEKYENVKLFGDDLALYWLDIPIERGKNTEIGTPVEPTELLDNTIEPLLSSTDFFAVIGSLFEQEDLSPTQIRTQFTNNEREDILDELQKAVDGDMSSITLYHLLDSDGDEEWVTENNLPSEGTFDSRTSMLTISTRFDGANLIGWRVKSRARRMVAQSPNTRFWSPTEADQLLSFDTLNTVRDKIIVLKANPNANNDKLLKQNINFPVLGVEKDSKNALPDINCLSVLPEDSNSDGIADDLQQQELFDFEVEGTWPIKEIDGGTESSQTIIDLSDVEKRYNNSTSFGLDEDVRVYVDDERLTFEEDDLEVYDSDELVNEKIRINDDLTDKKVRVIVYSYVYFNRADMNSEWEPKEDTEAIRKEFLTEDVDEPEVDGLFTRRLGRYPLNFGWFKFTSDRTLVDPSPSNIHDMFIITRGYFEDMSRYLRGIRSSKPSPPTPLDLRLSYSDLLDNKMLSDTVVLNTGEFKLLFGSRADERLRARFKVIRPVEARGLTNNEVKVRIADITRRFLDVESWEFGETFYFTELATAIHLELKTEIDSVVLVPTSSDNQFGDMFEVKARENEVFLPDIDPSIIDIVQSFTSDNLRQ